MIFPFHRLALTAPVALASFAAAVLNRRWMPGRLSLILSSLLAAPRPIPGDRDAASGLHSVGSFLQTGIDSLAGFGRGLRTGMPETIQIGESDNAEINA